MKRRTQCIIIAALTALVVPAVATAQQPPAKQAKQTAPQKAAFSISPQDVTVPTDLPYREQVKRHHDALLKLSQALTVAQEHKKTARAKNSLPDYLAAEEDEQNTTHFLAPYAIAEGKATSLRDRGFKLKNTDDTKGEICNAKGECSEVDPITALIMMIIGALTDEFNKKKPFGPSNDLIKFIRKPAGGPNSTLSQIREVMLFHDKNGEIAKLVRDPVKRPIEIVQSWRDKVVPKDDRGEIARALRDPIKCTIGKLWKKCP